MHEQQDDLVDAESDKKRQCRYDTCMPHVTLGPPTPPLQYNRQDEERRPELRYRDHDPVQHWTYACGRIDPLRYCLIHVVTHPKRLVRVAIEHE
jgi:hypothetical protein